MKTILAYINLAATITLAGYIFMGGEQEKIYFVDNIKLFSSFSMKKQLEKELIISQKKDEVHLDSLRMMLNGLYSSMADSKNKNNEAMIIRSRQLEQHIAASEMEIAEKNERLVHDTDEKIWTRLNRYVSEYGEKNECKLILGSSGNGNIMYGVQQVDITTAVIDFVNQRYTGQP